MRIDAASSQHETRHEAAAETIEVVAKIGPDGVASLERAAVGGSLWDLPGCATAFCLGADIFGTMWHLTSLRYGEAGLVADCVEPIEPGSKISLGFEAPGYVAKRGEVVACREQGSSFRIAVRFEHRLAA